MPCSMFRLLIHYWLYSGFSCGGFWRHNTFMSTLNTAFKLPSALLMVSLEDSHTLKSHGSSDWTVGARSCLLPGRPHYEYFSRSVLIDRGVHLVSCQMDTREVSVGIKRPERGCYLSSINMPRLVMYLTPTPTYI